MVFNASFIYPFKCVVYYLTHSVLNYFFRNRGSSFYAAFTHCFIGIFIPNGSLIVVVTLQASPLPQPHLCLSCVKENTYLFGS